MLAEENKLVESVEVTDDKVHIIHLKSVFDASTVDEFERVLTYLMSNDCYKFVIDLAQVEFISSAGWGVFVGELQKIRDNSGDVKLANMDSEVYDVYLLLELDMFIKAYESVDEALDDFANNVIGVKLSSLPHAEERGKEPAPPPRPPAQEPAPSARQMPGDIPAPDSVQQISPQATKVPTAPPPAQEPPASQPQAEQPAAQQQPAAPQPETPRQPAAPQAPRPAPSEPTQPAPQQPPARQPAQPPAQHSQPPPSQRPPQHPAQPAPEALDRIADPYTTDGERIAETPPPVPEAERIVEVRVGREARPAHPESRGVRPGGRQSPPVPHKHPSTMSLLEALGSAHEEAELEREQAAAQEKTGSYLFDLDFLNGSSLASESEGDDDEYQASESYSSGTTIRSADLKTDPLLEKIISVVLANPAYGPSSIRQMLIKLNMANDSLTRSDIYRKLEEVNLSTRAKRMAFAKAHAPE